MGCNNSKVPLETTNKANTKNGDLVKERKTSNGSNDVSSKQETNTRTDQELKVLTTDKKKEKEMQRKREYENDKKQEGEKDKARAKGKEKESANKNETAGQKMYPSRVTVDPPTEDARRPHLTMGSRRSIYDLYEEDTLSGIYKVAEELLQAPYYPKSLHSIKSSVVIRRKLSASLQTL